MWAAAQLTEMVRMIMNDIMISNITWLTYANILQQTFHAMLSPYTFSAIHHRLSRILHFFWGILIFVCSCHPPKRQQLSQDVFPHLELGYLHLEPQMNDEL